MATPSSNLAWRIAWTEQPGGLQSTQLQKKKKKKQLSTCTDNWKTQVRKIISGIESESDVTQSCPTLSDPMDCSLPGSSVHGIFQARVLEWCAIAFSTLILNKGKKNPKNSFC